MIERVSFAFAFLVFAAALVPAGPAQGRDALAQGPKVGAKIPHTLAAKDQFGKPQRFQTLKSRRGLILLFTRSFDW